MSLTVARPSIKRPDPIMSRLFFNLALFTLQKKGGIAVAATLSVKHIRKITRVNLLLFFFIQKQHPINKSQHNTKSNIIHISNQCATLPYI